MALQRPNRIDSNSVTPIPGLEYNWRQLLQWEYTATGAIVPSFQANTIVNPYDIAILKGIRFNALFTNAAAQVTQLLDQGWIIFFASNNNETMSLAQAVSGGGTSPGAALGTFPLIQFTIPKEQTSQFIKCEAVINQRNMVTTTINPLGSSLVAAPAGKLVALNDQMRITLEMYFQV